MYRFVSYAASVLLAFGLSVVKWFLRWRPYRRTRNELENLGESDLRDLKISKGDFSAIARDEAARRHALKPGLRLWTGSRGRAPPFFTAEAPQMLSSRLKMTMHAVDQKGSLERPLFERAEHALGPLPPDEMYAFEAASSHESDSVGTAALLPT